MDTVIEIIQDDLNFIFPENREYNEACAEVILRDILKYYNIEKKGE